MSIGLIKVITGLIGGIGLFISLFAVWFIFQNINPWDVLPYEILSSSFFPIWEFLAGSFFLILIIIAFVIALLLAYGGKDDDRKERRQRWLWAKREKKPYWPWKK